MPNPFARATSPASRPRRGGPADRRRSPAPNLIEGLEDRCLFALAVSPLPAGASATTLGNQIVVPGTGLTVTGGTYTGANNQGGTYTGLDITSQLAHIDIADGVLLTDGLSTDALGPNLNPRQSTVQGTAGDVDLTTLMGQPTFDANALTLQFTAAAGTNSILFDFIFGSDEYRELRGNLIVDAFAVYVDGTQVVLDEGTPPRPMTVNNSLVTIDNSFVGSTNLLNIQYDGLTPRLRTRAPLNTALGTHTIKFVIADTGAPTIDSAAFIARLQGSTVLVGGATTGAAAPGVIQFNTVDYSVSENGGLATILVQRTNSTQGAVSVNYAVTDGSATNGADYTATTGTILLQDQQASATFTVPILDDTAAEGDETVVLTLSNAVDATLGSPSTATLTIVENESGIRFADPTPLDAAVTYSVSENVGSATITVERFGDLSLPATVTYATNGTGTATAGQDFAATTGTLSFAAGESSKTFAVPVRADFIDEATETIGLELTNVSAGTLLGTGAAATIAVSDLNRPPSLYDITAFAPANKIEALFLVFNTEMVPERMLDPDNYRVFVHNEGKPAGSSRTAVKLQAPEYNAAGKTVTLRPMTVFRQNVFYEIVVRTRTIAGVRSTTNQMLDGNLNGQLDLPQFGGGYPSSGGFGFFPSVPTGDLASSPGEDFVGFFGRGNRLNYVDHDGNRVRISVDGGGVAEVLRNSGHEAQQVRIVNAVPSSFVYGKVAARRGSDGITTISDLLLGGAQNRLSPPQFKVGWVL